MADVVNNGAINKTRWGVEADKLNAKFNSIDSGMLNANANIANINDRLDGIDSDITNVSGRLDGVDSELTTINNRLDGIDSDLTTINTTVSNINGRVNSLETLLQEIDVRLQQLEGEVADEILRFYCEENQTTVGQINEPIATSFMITEGSEDFTIDDSGLIEFKFAPDYEVKNEYSLKVTSNKGWRYIIRVDVTDVVSQFEYNYDTEYNYNTTY